MATPCFYLINKLNFILLNVLEDISVTGKPIVGTIQVLAAGYSHN